MSHLHGRAGLECPTCKSSGLFNYPKSFGERYGPDNFFCETCDPNHQQPIKRKKLEQRGIIDQTIDPTKQP